MTAPAVITDDKDRIRANVAKMQKAGASETEIEHYLRDIEGLSPTSEVPETAGDRAAGALATAYQGMTLGQGDKIIAGIQTVLPEALGGQPGWDFKQNLADTREVLSNYRERHPDAADTMEMVGSTPLLMAGGSAATKVGGRVLKGASKMIDGLDTKLLGEAAEKASPRLRLVVGAGRGLRSILKRPTPKAEGFIGNDIGNLSEAARVGDRSRPDPRRVLSLEERLQQVMPPAVEEAMPQAEGFVGNGLANLNDIPVEVVTGIGRRSGQGVPIRPQPQTSSAAATLEERLAEAAATPRAARTPEQVSLLRWKNRRAPGATKARDAFWADPSARESGKSVMESMADHLAKGRAAPKQSAEPTLEDLLALSRDVTKNRMSLADLSRLTSKVRQP